jgi:hypothetical protein
MGPKGSQSALEFYGVGVEETFTSTPQELALIDAGLKAVDKGRIRDFGEAMTELREKHHV